MKETTFFRHAFEHKESLVSVFLFDTNYTHDVQGAYMPVLVHAKHMENNIIVHLVSQTHCKKIIYFLHFAIIKNPIINIIVQQFV